MNLRIVTIFFSSLLSFSFLLAQNVDLERIHWARAFSDGDLIKVEAYDRNDELVATFGLWKQDIEEPIEYRFDEIASMYSIEVDIYRPVEVLSSADFFGVTIPLYFEVYRHGGDYAQWRCDFSTRFTPVQHKEFEDVYTFMENCLTGNPSTSILFGSRRISFFAYPANVNLILIDNDETIPPPAIVIR